MEGEPTKEEVLKAESLEKIDAILKNTNFYGPEMNPLSSVNYKSNEPLTDPAGLHAESFVYALIELRKSIEASNSIEDLQKLSNRIPYKYKIGKPE